MADNLTDIAIIGMAGRFPGARDIGELWRNLCAGRESIRFFTVEELEDDESRAQAQQPNYVRARAIMDDVDKFDASFFGIYPREAELIDPQQRIFLECCWHAFEDAGYDPLTYKDVVGVFAGCSPNSYFLKHVCADRDSIGVYSAGYQVSDFVKTLGTNSDFLATRVAYKLNLKGPAFSLNCGCSTSLVAVSQACLSLQNYQIDMALAGGVSITFPQRRGYLYEPGGMVSPDGHCRTFDRDAQGTVFGDGAAVVLLKRLEDALVDGDRIYALIKGFGITNDGSVKVGFTAPGIEGQARAIAMAHAAAGVEPRSISYIEAHGTGTPLGDPIEIAALTQAFRRETQDRAFCAIGTAKTSIGHLDIAAGATGMIKTALSLYYRLLPPMLHFRRPNPRLDLEDSPFYVNASLTPWQRRDTPLRAGVSAFGVGGTNVHIVMEEAPEATSIPTQRGAHLIVLSAKTDRALDAATDNLAAHLTASPGHELADVAHALMVGRHAFVERRFVVVHNSAEAATILVSHAPSRVVTRSCKTERLNVAFMFPGQGAQHAGMGRQLYAIDAGFRADVDQCMSILKATAGLDFGSVLYPEDALENGHINDTAFAQPAIFTVEYALARLWMRLGIRPAAMIGHSVGELVAACLAGVFPLEQAIRLIAERGRLMQALPSGAMLSIGLGEAQVVSMLDGRLSLAATNGPSLTVASGPEDAIVNLEDRLGKEGIVCRRLRTSHAFHSAMMDPVREPFARLVRSVALSAPKIPFISGVTGTWISDAEGTDPDYWVNHLRQPVRFAAGIGQLRGLGYGLLEVGPGRALSVLARQQPAKNRDQIVLTSLPEPGGGQTDEESILNALGHLWLSGADPDWSAVYAGEKRRRISLPLYPFERRRLWIDTARAGLRAAAPAAGAEQPSSFDRAEALAEAKYTVHESAPEQQHLQDTVAAPNGQQDVETGQMQTEQPLNRETRIRSILDSIFQDLSGIDVSAAGESTTFLELGFDSLFLTQVSQALQSKFGIKITFRQLLDQQSTLDSLATHIDRHIAPDALRDIALAGSAGQLHPIAVAQSSQGSAAVAASPVPASSDGSAVQLAGAGNLEALFNTQLQMMSDLMSKQLEVLRSAGNAASGNRNDGGAEATPAPMPPVLTTPLGLTTHSPTNGNGPQPRKFLPFRPVEAGAGSGLNPLQQQHLHALIERYNRKTAGSKRYTEAHRDHLADPRVAAGFRVEWKELVYPIVAVRSKGSRLWDIDGNQYIDVVNGYGPIMFGHAPEFVTEAITAQLQHGYETGPQSPLAGEVADLICEMTGMDRVTFCNTGSEAVTAALRVARTVTGRNKVVLFTGAYHGMFDEVVVKGVPGPNGPRSLPVAPGIPREKVENVVVLDYGTPEALTYIESHATELAAVLIEPVQSRHPGLRPVEFLRHVRCVTEQSGTALIFDEVVTGFRVHPGGCQAVFGIKADLATYGKVLAGGLPIGILAGRAAFMDALDGGPWNYGDDSFPETGVTFFAGTFVRHPLALAAASAVLKHLKESGPQLQERLNARTSAVVARLNDILRNRGIPVEIESFGSVSYLGFPADYRFAGLFYYVMREKGIYIQEGFPLFLTTAHSDEDIDKVVTAFKESLVEMQAAGFLPAIPVTEGVHVRNGTQPPLCVYGVDPHPLAREQSLRKAKSSPADSVVAPTTRRAPLTESQLEIWLSASLSDEASCAYNESFRLKLQGVLNLLALQEAVDRLIQRHEALRTTFSPDGDFQEFAPKLKIAVPIEDLSDLDESQRSAHLTELIAADARSPFNLTVGPLVRVKVVRIGLEQHHVLFTSHHIVCDGWSTNVILDELSKLYNALSSANECEFPTPMGFGAYARLQAEQFSSGGGAANESYWVEQFKTPVAPLDLPLDRPRPAIKSYDGATFRRIIPVETYRSIKQLAAKNKCTLFVALLAGFQALLSRLSGQDDVVVGIPAAGQSLLDDEILVGHCVNFLPLRGRLKNDPAMAAYLRQVKATLLDAYDHQNYTYGRLVRTLTLQRDPSRLPLMEVQFNLEHVGAGIEFSGLAAEVDPNPKAFVNHDLFLNIIESDQGLILDCDYNSGLFDRATIDRWLGHYQTLLEGMVSNVSAPVSRLPLLSDSEIQRIVVDWNDTRLDYPRDKCVHQLFEEQATRTPNAIAAVFKDEQISYADLDARANQLANYVRGLGGVPRSLVAICMPRSLKMLIALLGIMKAGCAYIPLDPVYPEERLRYILEETNATLTLTETSVESSLSACRGARICVDAEWPRIAAESEAAPPSVITGQDLAYVIYTSGSTGRPKGVEIPHRAYVNLLKAMSLRPGLKEGDILLAVTTLAFDIAGLELMLPLIVGGELMIASRETAADGAALLGEIQHTGANVMQATPITWRQLLEAGWTGDPRLKMLCGGEALPPDLAARLTATGGELWNMYGPTETTIWSATDLIGEDGKVSIGKPIANTRLYILDEFGQPAPIGVVGDLYIGGDGLARGYFKRPELTAEKFISSVSPHLRDIRLFKTGDLARYLADGRIECLGRRDSQIKLRGYRIELGEIESLLAESGAVQEAAVALDLDDSGEPRLVAYIVGGAGTLAETAQLRTFLRKRVPEYMVPSAFVTLESMPRTTNGKLDRKSLPRPSSPAPSRDAAYGAPTSTEEKVLCQIWAEVLGVSSVGVDDDIFALGADSLHIFKIATRASKAGLALEALQIFEQRTVAQLAKHVRLAGLASETRRERPALAALGETNGR
jgi:amino acid adenylation domain-containing protein